MFYLAAILLSLVLLGGFLFLTRLETARGMRLFASARASLDESVEGVARTASRIDLPAFLWHAAKDTFARLAHDAVALVIYLLRAVEHLLLRVIRALRTRRPGLASLASRGSAFVEHIAHYKRSLRSKAPAEGETPSPPQI